MNTQSPDYIGRTFTWEDLRQPHCLDLITTLLDAGLDVRFTVTGRSMQPFLRGGESVTLRKELPAKLRTGDLIFFQDNRNALILHRIVWEKTVNDGVILQTKGDGRSHLDEPVAAKNILGKVMRIEDTKHNVSIDMLAFRWIVSNYIIAVTSRLQIPFNRLAPPPVLRRKFFCSISRIIVFLSAR